MNRKQRRFTVVLDVPEGATLYEVRTYLLEATRQWCDNTGPNNPMRNLDLTSVHVENGDERR